MLPLIDNLVLDPQVCNDKGLMSVEITHPASIDASQSSSGPPARSDSTWLLLRRRVIIGFISFSIMTTLDFALPRALFPNSNVSPSIWLYFNFVLDIYCYFLLDQNDFKYYDNCCRQVCPWLIIVTVTVQCNSIESCTSFAVNAKLHSRRPRLQSKPHHHSAMQAKICFCFSPESQDKNAINEGKACVRPIVYTAIRTCWQPTNRYSVIVCPFEMGLNGH